MCLCVCMSRGGGGGSGVGGGGRIIKKIERMFNATGRSC